MTNLKNIERIARGEQRHILLPVGMKKRLREEFQCSAQMVRNALEYRSMSEFAIQIRAAALANYGGVLWEKEEA